MKSVFSKHLSVYILFSFLLCGAIMLFASCQKKEVTPPAPSQSTAFSIYLTDAPAAYQAILIDIQKIWVNATDSTNSGWLEVPLTRTGRFNLMDFRNGKDTLLAKADLPSGAITQMRLELGDDNQLVFLDGQSVPLNLTSDDEAGMKWNINVSLRPEAPYALVVDFNTAESIKLGGEDSNYFFHPAFRTFTKGSGGAIEGLVLPDSAHAAITAIHGTDTLSAIPDTTGYYKFQGLNAGTYQLLFTPDSAARFERDTLDSIQAVKGQVTKADTVWLKQKEGIEIYPQLP